MSARHGLYLDLKITNGFTTYTYEYKAFDKFGNDTQLGWEASMYITTSNMDVVKWEIFNKP